ncbi:hypothetical protein CAPTEDRAFT_170758 [Capitella teleta]|uniref:RRM domain-containing protein n=1 Tax=Capitella teleta TaxID=283909 RepID=R7TIV9_CAPTE|nr:hypothetical protein CAPTEDRAFT_170758 [Capitella teleta]|eukprot:ELT93758.1 hypothetical protein CAPTEDRAFT_170758 [Capitella teleta]
MEDNQQIPANGETDFEQHYGDNGDQLGMAEHTEMQQEMPEQGMESAELGGSQHAGSCEDEESRKIFVGGLSWETTVKDMKDYFSKFGEVTDATLKTDQNTGRSRGFGFVTFVDSTCVNRVIEQTQHTLHGKNIDPKRAKARPGREPVKKIFVGGLDPEVPEDEIRQHFSKYGKVEEVELPFDRSKNQRRFFCFVSFDTGEAVDALCQESEKHVLGGKNVRRLWRWIRRRLGRRKRWLQ